MAVDLAKLERSRQDAQGVAPGYWICPACSVVYSIVAQSTYVPAFGHLCRKCCAPEMVEEAERLSRAD